ncbi:MAG: hypothetical protein RLZZ225_1047, partial [Pseudomonadota bacterium]
MIIEALTAFSAVKITWETLEILHLLRVGHETGRDVCKAGNFVTNAVQQQLQEWQYERDPLLKFVHEAKTDYDFQTTGDAEKAFQKVNKRAQTYLNLLNESLGILNDAKRYFLETHRSLERLVNALHCENEPEFLSQLSNFKNNFSCFKVEYKRFSLKIEPPNRKNLYIAEISKGTSSIEKFNAYLKSIDECFCELKETKEKMAVLFENDFRVPEAMSRSTRSFEQLKQQIRVCMDKPELIPETMQKILPKNLQLAGFCAEIAQISAEFKKTDSAGNEQTNLWSDDPNWLPLLTEEEQIEAGQRIFLHAMNETEHRGNIKLQFAKIFLCQYVSKYALNQITIQLLSLRLANLLIAEQLKKCGKLIEFLNNLKEVEILPAHDLDGLLEWLKIKRKIVNSVEYWKKILVSPYRLSKYNIESLRSKLETLLPDENTDSMIKDYRASYWGAIREKSDQLIQFPVSFKTKIIPDDRFQQDKQFVKDSNVVTPLMRELAKMLIIELEALKEELSQKKERLEEDTLALRGEEHRVRTEMKNLAHENGVERIKESHRYIASIDEFCNRLFPYLYRPKILNEAEKKRRVPTVEDLIQVIYTGVDLHGVCKCKGDPHSNSNLLLDYFYPEQADDSRMEAFAYAMNKCQIHAQPLLHLYAYPADPLLAIGNGNERNSSLNPSLVMILQNSKKISVPAHSLALNNISPKAKEETETFINQLGDYAHLALMRVRPELRNGLALVDKFKLLVQGLFNFGQNIREERFESVQIIMGKLHAVFSAEDIMSINKAIHDFKEDYENRYKIAKKTYSSTLYNLTKKAMSGCILEMHCLSETEQKQLELDIEKAKVETLQGSLDVMKQEKEVLQTQRVKDKKAMEAMELQLKQDKKVMEAMKLQLKQDKEAMKLQL